MCSSEKIKNLVTNETEYTNQQVLHTLIIKIHVPIFNSRTSEKNLAFSDKNSMTIGKPFWNFSTRIS